jgi:hypothetical protein
MNLQYKIGGSEKGPLGILRLKVKNYANLKKERGGRSRFFYLKK